MIDARCCHALFLLRRRSERAPARLALRTPTAITDAQRRLGRGSDRPEERAGRAIFYHLARARALRLENIIIISMQHMVTTATSTTPQSIQCLLLAQIGHWPYLL